MITAIELGNFLSHTETKLEFDDGVTVFVGDNGAGKSSIIDAITFALFGEHTRKTNKGLIKRGSNQGFAKIDFKIRGRQYQSVRKIDSKGAIIAKFSEIVNDNVIEIAAGERKQFGESMTREIEKTIGLDFEKLKIASIVQQGELNAIIRARPKEFKELLNAIIGIDKLNIAADEMKTIIKEFREKIKENFGYDDTHIDILEKELEKNLQDLENVKPQKEELVSLQSDLKKEITELRAKLEMETPKIDKINQLEQRKEELRSYAKEAIYEIQKEINEKERKIRECEGCFEFIDSKETLESKLKKVEYAIQETQKKLQELTSKIASLNEKIDLAIKLQLKDSKCPVCDSKVDKLKPLFQEEHLRNEIKNIQEKIINTENELRVYNQKQKEFFEKLQNARDAEATLRAHAITDKEEIVKMQKEIEVKRKSVQKIPTKTNENLIAISEIDSHSKMIFEYILKLELDTKNFDESQFQKMKTDINEKQFRLSNIDQQIGAITEKISKNEETIKNTENTLKQLRIVKKYVTELNSIQTSVFSRDGPVATSLRSWALNTISSKASEYLTLLNTKIQRIHLSEKLRDISIACFSKKEKLEIESLSGGEQVSVALALRLGMASLLGASNLNLMILDEPTTHLDAERKKSLVRVLSQLSDIVKSQIPVQFIIITHDSEIFEDSNVERIYKFESTEQGSKVISI